MKALIAHLIAERLPQIAAASLLNCHVPGLHSIMLLDTPEQRVRLFVATAEHELYQNSTDSLPTLAAHPHHCNITLHCLRGQVVNLSYELAKDGQYKPFRYQSSILTGTGGFTPEPTARAAKYAGFTKLRPGRSLYLPANAIHSVWVPARCVAAWFVYEGKEDEAYSSLSYSDQDLTQVSFDGLYQPMSEAQVLEYLEMAGLYQHAKTTA